MTDLDDMQLLFEVFENTARQGPGSVATTRHALSLLPAGMLLERILDLGCGTGGSTLVLAEDLAEDTAAQITAVDIHPPFLETLRSQAQQRGIAERITTLAADMSDPAALGSGYDLVWAEGSAYSIGFENALALWRALLRPAGCLVVTELVWFCQHPAERAREFFAEEYPDMKDEARRIEDARRAGYEVLASFRLPAEDWKAYYAGVEASLAQAIRRRGEHEVYDALRREADTYEACGEDYGYLCLVLQVRGGQDAATTA